MKYSKESKSFLQGSTSTMMVGSCFRVLMQPFTPSMTPVPSAPSRHLAFQAFFTLSRRFIYQSQIARVKLVLVLENHSLFMRSKLKFGESFCKGFPTLGKF